MPAKPPEHPHDLWCHYTWRECVCWAVQFMSIVSFIFWYGGLFSLMMVLTMNPVKAVKG